jgi:O-antigen/teichoic acid export membrane protein
MNLFSLFHKYRSSSTGKDSTYSLIGYAVAAVMGAVFYAIAFRLMGASLFGIFSLSLTTAAILKDILDPSLNTTLIRFRPKFTEPYQVVRHVLRLRLIYFGIIGGIGLLIPGILSRLIFRVDLPILFVLTILTAMVLSWGSFISGFLQSHKRFMADGVFVSSQPLFRLIFLGFAIYLHKTDILSMVIVNGLAYVVTDLVAMKVVDLKQLIGKIPADVSSTTNKFLVPMTFSSLTGTLTDRIGLYIINYLLGPASVGLLSATLRLFIPVQQITGVLSSVFGSRFASFTNSKDTKNFHKKTLLLTVGMAIALVIIGLFSKPLLLLIYGAQFTPAVPIFQILCIAFAIFLTQTSFTAKLLYSKGRSDLMARISLVQLITTISLNLILIPIFHLYGAAIALVGVLLISSLLTIHWSRE